MGTRGRTTQWLWATIADGRQRKSDLRKASWMKAVVLGCLLGTFCSSVAPACDRSWGTGPKPTWYEMINRADVVFVGRVVATCPETAEGFGRAEFEVENWIKGGSGAHFAAAQGSGGNCVAEFQTGSRVIFVGNWMQLASAGGAIAVAESTGWDGVVYLNAPPTPEEKAQLDYVESLR